MRRSHLVAASAFSLALLSAAACTSLKVDEPTAGTDGSTPETPTATAPPTDGDGSTPPRDGGKDAANDPDGAACPGACTAKAVSVCNGNVSETTLGLGSCERGQCVYPKVSRTCSTTCKDGLCAEIVWSAVETTSGPYHAVWGAAPNDLWAGGASVSRFDGTRWSRVDVGLAGKTVVAIGGASRTDVVLLVTGADALELHRVVNGSASLLATLPCTLPIGSLFAHTTNEYFVHCGDSGIFRVRTPGATVDTIVANPGSFAPGQTLHNALDGFVFDDGELTLMGAGTSTGYFYTNLDGGSVRTGGVRAFSVVNRRDVFGFLEIGLEATLYPTDGGSPTTTALNAAIGEPSGYWRSLVGGSRNRLFAGGSRGVIAHFDGTSWHKDTAPGASVTTPFTSMWASPWGDVFATGQNVWQGR